MRDPHTWPNLLAVLVTLATSAAAAPPQEMPIDALRDWQFFNNAGWRSLQNKEYAKAEERFNAAIRVVRPYEATERRLMARSYHDLARVLYHEGRFAEAEPLATWALGVRESNPKVKPADVFQSLRTLGLIHAARRHHVEAERLLRRALDLQEKTLGPSHADVASTLDVLAGICGEQGKYPEAERLYKRAVALQSRNAPDENLDLAETSEHYAVLLRRMKRDDEAADLEERALAIRDTAATKAARARAARSDPGFRGFK
jgi:tetratricopeptide (TPR) repeat protein